MIYRNLGKTGIMVSEVGMGCNRLGESNQPDTHWIKLAQMAVDLGVNIFDTAEAYGWGRSEEMLGHAVGNRSDVYIATKMCRVHEINKTDFSAARMAQTVEGSLKRLKRDCIDIYQLHSPSRQDMEKFDWADGMAKLKKQGKIRFCAVAVNSVADGIWLMEKDIVEVLQITYNIFETEAQDKLFDVAKIHGVGLLCRMPLARGVLTGKFHPDQEIPEGHRALLDKQHLIKRIKMVEGLKPIAEKYEGGITRMALHFSLTPKAISAIIPGARAFEQLKENVSASNGVGLPDHILNKLKQFDAGE
jgi:aryl-alcohol dehydrogenase-like predicted oxidoreductase